MIKEKWNKLKLFSSEKQYGFLIWAFIIPVILMWMIYIALEVYPFGENSVLVLDLNGQYVYFFEELRSKVLEGGNFLYTWGRSLGGEFLGIYAYYLASPFSFLVALFPENHITEALLCIILLKTGSMGVTMSIYLNSLRPKKKLSVIMFSTMYAMSAYAVVQAHNTMWIDNLILLPLVALGIEQLICKKKFKLFVISLSLALLTSFYIGYMTCLFVVVYFFYYYFAHDTNNDNNFYLETNHFWKSFARIAVYSAIAVSIAMVIIYPAYTSLQFGKNEFSHPTFAFTQNFDFLDFFVKLFPGSYDTVRPEGLPFVYCSTFALILVPVYFITSRIKSTERMMSGVLLGFFLLCFNTSAIDIVWHGFQRPNWLNYRYSFMFIFLMLVMAYKAFENIKFANYKHVVFVTGVFCVLLLLIQKQEYEFVDDMKCIWLSLACLAIYAVALYAEYRGVVSKNSTAVLTIIVCLELFAAGLLNTVALDEDVVISSRTSYNGFMEKVRPLVDWIHDNDDSEFYRMEKNIHRKTNDPMTLGYYGISNSTSTLNTSVIKLLNQFGYASKSHWTKYLGGTPVSDSLLGIKYVIGNSSFKDNLIYDDIYYDSEHAYTVYKNPYALSLAYGVSDDINDVEFSDYKTSFELLNKVITSMLGKTDNVEIFRPLTVTDTSMKNIDISFTTGHKKYAADNEALPAEISYTFDVPAGASVYMEIPTNYPRECSLSVNNVSFGTYFGNETDRAVHLGVYEEATEVIVKLSIKDDPLYIMNDENYFYYIDMDAFDTCMTSLEESDLDITFFSDTVIEGNVNIVEGRDFLFTTIPYDTGWHVTVDGQEVETVMVANSLLAVEIGEGEHEIRFEYLPKCYTVGLTVTVIGIAAFIVAIIIDFIRKKRELKKWAEENYIF